MKEKIQKAAFPVKRFKIIIESVKQTKIKGGGGPNDEEIE